MSGEITEAADRRDCPKCGKECMAVATRCGYCWTALTPLVPGSEGSRIGATETCWTPDPIDEAQRQDCPKCGKRIMLAAIKCGFCWITLPARPIPAAAAVA